MSSTGKSRKLSVAHYIQAMEDHEVYFEGRMLPEEWGEYAGIFREIRRIGNIKPAEFVAQYDQNDPFVLELQENASRLTRGAWYCLNDSDTEYGWRKEVEFPAFESFEREITWHVLSCRGIISPPLIDTVWAARRDVGNRFLKPDPTILTKPRDLKEDDAVGSFVSVAVLNVRPSGSESKRQSVASLSS